MGAEEGRREISEGFGATHTHTNYCMTWHDIRGRDRDVSIPINLHRRRVHNV